MPIEASQCLPASCISGPVSLFHWASSSAPFGFSVNDVINPSSFFFEDAEIRCFAFHNRNGGDGNIRTVFDMVIQHRHEIHLVKLIAREDQYIFAGKSADVPQPLPHSICRTLVPGWVIRCLLGSKNINECRAECAEVIGVLDVPVQRCRVILRQYEHSADA